MNRNTGRLRLLYPVSAEPFHCQSYEDGNRFTFQLGGGGGGDFQDPIGLQIEHVQTGQGLCRDEWGRTRPFAWAWVGPQLHLWLDGDPFVFEHEDSTSRRDTPRANEPGGVLAPMPGAVLDVLVAEGDRVEPNQAVILMESMKMELVITAPCNAVVQRVAAQPGQQVERGMRLLELAPEEPDDG